MATKPKAAAPAAKAAAKKPGTAVAVKKASGGGLMDIKAMMAAEVAGLANRTAAPGGDKIQLKNKKFVLPNGESTEVLNVVILDFVSMNNFYENAYDAKNIVPPTCFAIGQVPTQMVPSDNAPVKQSDACQTCPMNQFGSAGDGKACKNMRRLAVLPPDADEETPVWILDVSPTGLKSFDGYVRSVASKFNMPPVGVVTEITFATDVEYASLRFGNPEPNEGMENHWGRRQEALDRLSQEPDVSAYETAVKPPPRGRAGAKPAARR